MPSASGFMSTRVISVISSNPTFNLLYVCDFFKTSKSVEAS